MRRSLVAAGLVAALALALGGCSDDDEPAPSTTTDSSMAAEPSAPTSGSGSSTTTAPDGSSTTTTAPAESGPAELRSALVAPATLGEGYAPDATVGTGAFSGELCEDVTLEATWDDQASQALSRGQGTEQEVVTQSVLAFADADAAEDFVAALVDGTEQCLGAAEGGPVEAGEEAELRQVASDPFTTSLGVVRVGATVSAFSGLRPSAADASVTAELLVAAGELLTA